MQSAFISRNLGNIYTNSSTVSLQSTAESYANLVNNAEVSSKVRLGTTDFEVLSRRISLTQQ